MLSTSLSAVLIASAAVAFGFLENTDGHPSLKLMGAIVLAFAGTALVLLVPRRRAQPSAAAAPSLERVVRVGLALLSVSAALIHLAVIQQHLEEFWLYGAFFIVVGGAQLAWPLLILARPSRTWAVLGAVGNLVVAGVWVLTRTAGALIGPDADEVVPAGFGDVVSTVFEVLIVIGALILLRYLHRGRALRPRTAETATALGAVSVTLITTLALFSAVGGSPFVTPVG